MKKINLVNNQNSEEEIYELSEWIKTYPQFTMGPKVKEFEEKFADYTGTKYAVMTNSGSSANLIAVYALKIYLKNFFNFVVVPALSWATTISPYIIMDPFTTMLCDCNYDNLGLDIDHLVYLINEHPPSIIQTVNVLGFPNDYNEILNLCERDNIAVLEDSCEALGSTYGDLKCGNFGKISTFSFFFGHIISTMEGGMCCTDVPEINKILRMIRAHGWDRNIDSDAQDLLRKENNISDFYSYYTFYYPGFNVRPMEIQAFLGLKQLEKIDYIVSERKNNYKLYGELLQNVIWKPQPNDNIVNFAYPIMVENIGGVVQRLTKNGIECRPIIAGSMAKQPFYRNYSYTIITKTPNADKIHNKGLYLPNYPGLGEENIKYICNVVNENVQ